jgi:hypothetical protein
MARIIGHKWTPHDDHLLITAWEAGATAVVIAASFTERGIPMQRSAILGRINRLRKAGLAISERTPQRRSTAAKRRQPEAKAAPPRPPEPAPAPAVTPQPAPRPEPLTGRPLTLWGRWPSKACRWPIFDRVTHTDPIFCGQPVAETGCYCTEHALRARAKPRPTTSKAGAASSPRARTHF